MNLTNLPISANVAIFVFSAVVVWLAGARLSRYVDKLGAKTGLGHAFAGMLLLGGITSLPEGAAVSSAAATGNASLALNNVFGSCAMNLLLIAVADAAIGHKALTSFVSRPATLLQGALGTFGLSLAAMAAIVGDAEIYIVGGWSLAILAYASFAFWLAYLYRGRAPWIAQDSTEGQKARPERRTDADTDGRITHLVVATAATGTIILVAGFALSTSGDAIARQTGLEAGVVGFILVGFATSLPELSTVIAAVRLGRYEMAVGDIFGTNLFNLALITVADLFFVGGAILNEAGPFEALAALLGILLTAAFVIGLLERGNRTLLRMGYDSAAVIVFYVGGAMLLVLAVPQS